MKIAKKEKNAMPDEEGKVKDEPQEIKETRMNIAVMKDKLYKAMTRKEKAEWDISSFMMGIEFMENDLTEKGYEVE